MNVKFGTVKFSTRAGEFYKLSQVKKTNLKNLKGSDIPTASYVSQILIHSRDLRLNERPRRLLRVWHRQEEGMQEFSQQTLGSRIRALSGTTDRRMSDAPPAATRPVSVPASEKGRLCAPPPCTRRGRGAPACARLWKDTPAPEKGRGHGARS